MTRTALLLVALFVLPLAGASHPEPEPPRGSVWTVYTTVEADVQDNYATVSIIADIGNRGPDPEFPFQVRVPADAFVTGFSIERDGQVWEGRIEDRDAAREEYEDQKGQENTAGLIEKKRGTQLYAFLINVAEFESVTATMTYEMVVPADQDVHSLALEAPVSGFGEDLGARFDVTVCHSAGVVSIASDPQASVSDNTCQQIQHSVGPRHNEAATPFDVHYSVAPTPDEGSIRSIVVDGVGYFVHPFRAPADAAQLHLDLVLVLDTSGSMGSESKLEQMQDAATQVIRRLDSNDRLGIVEFNSDTFTSLAALRPADAANRSAAQDAIDEYFAGGSTNIEAGLTDGLAAFDCDAACDPERSRIMVFLTDGKATIGTVDREDLRALAVQHNDADVRVFALAFGTGADYGLVAGLAKDNGGSALLVPQGTGAEVDLRRFMTALATPVLEDVRVDYSGSVTAYRNAAPVLFQGSELLVVGTFPGTMDRLQGTVTGTAAGGPRSYAFDEPVGNGDDWLPRMVAYAHIQHLQRLIDADGESTALVAELKDVALEWGFVTEYTSLVISTELDDPVRSMPEGHAQESAADRGGAGGSMSTGTTTSTRSHYSPGASNDSGGAGGADGSSGGSDGDEATEEPSTPGPGIVLVVGLLAALAALMRRR